RCHPPCGPDGNPVGAPDPHGERAWKAPRAFAAADLGLFCPTPSAHGLVVPGPAARGGVVAHDRAAAQWLQPSRGVARARPEPAHGPPFVQGAPRLRALSAAGP